MDNNIENKDKNAIFNRKLYITIPDDDNINGGLLSNGMKSLGDSYNGIDTPGKRFLTSSLLKKIEEGTPVNDNDIRIDLEKLKISDSYNNNNPIDDNEKEKFNKITKKSSFNKNINFNYENNNYNNKENNIEYFHDNHFVVSEDEDKEENEKEIIKNNIINNNNNIVLNSNEKEDKETKVNKELKEEDYIFEKFGKRGWQCSKCNNFNFESRMKCNRCLELKDPKTLEEIKKELEEKNSGDKKKKPLIERKGDWQCPNCHNLNFAFRQQCNRCHLSKEVYLNYKNQVQQQQQSNNNYGINLMNQPQIIQNQYNFIQNFGIVPNMYNYRRGGNDINNLNNNINNNLFWGLQQKNFNNNNNYNFWKLQLKSSLIKRKKYYKIIF